MALLWHHIGAASGNNIDLSDVIASEFDRACFKSRMQRPRAVAMRRVSSGNQAAVSRRWALSKAIHFFLGPRPDNVFFSGTAHIPLYLYPFLNTVSKNRPFEYLRLTSLGVIGALVKVATCNSKTGQWIRRRFLSRGVPFLFSLTILRS